MLQKAGALCSVLASGDIVFFLITNILHIYACLVTIFWVKSSEEATKSSTVELGVTVECWWLVQETLLYFINVINSFTQPFSLVDGIHQWKLFRNIGNMTQVSRECRKFQPCRAISVKILLTVIQKMDSFRSLDFIVMLQINQGWVYCFLFRDTQFHDSQFLNWVLVRLLLVSEYSNFCRNRELSWEWRLARGCQLTFFSWYYIILWCLL